jgi:hypothetical protein
VANSYRKPTNDSIFKSLNSIDQNNCTNTLTNSNNANSFRNYTKIKLPINFKQSFNSNQNVNSSLTGTKSFQKETMPDSKKLISSPIHNTKFSRVSSTNNVKEANILVSSNGNPVSLGNLTSYGASTNYLTVSIKRNGSNISSLKKYVRSQVRNNKMFCKPSNSNTLNMKTTSNSNQ